MEPLRQDQPPVGSLIADFVPREGHYPAHYVDAFRIDLPTEQYLRDYVSAFYTTWLFKMERFVLSVFAGAPATDADAMALAAGLTDEFAIWSVETRGAAEILLADRSGRTKSWLKVEPLETGTRLWFGSVVVPVAATDGAARIGAAFRLLEPLHKLYARALLRSAARALGG